MIIVLAADTSASEAGELLEKLEALGLRGRLMQEGVRPLIHVTSRDSKPALALARLEQVDGLARTSGPRLRAQGNRFYPYHFIRWSALSLVVIALLVLLAGQFPPGIGDAIDPREAPEELHHPWYLKAPLAFLALFPLSLAWLGSLVVLAVGAAILLLPWWDRTRSEGLRRRWPVLAVGMGCLAYVLYLTSTFEGGTG